MKEEEDIRLTSMGYSLWHYKTAGKIFGYASPHRSNTSAKMWIILVKVVEIVGFFYREKVCLLQSVTRKGSRVETYMLKVGFIND